MAAGEAQLTDLPGEVVTGLAADQDGLGADQHELTPRAGTRPAAAPPPSCRCRAPAWCTR